jgi:hypothetical protein
MREDQLDGLDQQRPGQHGVPGREQLDGAHPRVEPQLDRLAGGGLANALRKRFQLDARRHRLRPPGRFPGMVTGCEDQTEHGCRGGAGHACGSRSVAIHSPGWMRTELGFTDIDGRVIPPFELD